MDRLTPDTLVVASPDQVSSELDGEIILLNHRQGVYFGLDAGSGALIWRRLQRPTRVADLVAALREAYDVEEPRCRADVLALLQDLLAAGLIRTVDASR